MEIHLLTDVSDADAGSFDGASIRVHSGDMAPSGMHVVTFEVVVN